MTNPTESDSDAKVPDCPKCKGSNVAPGHLSVNGRSMALSMAFVPGELKWYRFSIEGGAELQQEVFACADCGMVWTKAAYPSMLRLLLNQISERKGGPR